MDTAYGTLHSVTSTIGRHGPLLLAIATILVALAIALAFVTVEVMTAASEATLVAPLRWLTRA